MVISELKKDAKIKLSGVYFKVILINLVYLIIVGVLEAFGNIINNDIFFTIFLWAIIINAKIIS